MSSLYHVVLPNAADIKAHSESTAFDRVVWFPKKKNPAVCETGSYVTMRTSGGELCTVVVENKFEKERNDARFCVK